jgi:hypothetical protein
MEDIFKKGDKVFCHYFGGWGKVEDIHLKNIVFPIRCSFPLGDGSFTEDGRFWVDGPPMLSFTEYTLEGFSQERPEPAPKLGDIVWGKGFHTTDWSIGHYLGKQHASYKISSTPNALSYWLAFTITTKNPYANE